MDKSWIRLVNRTSSDYSSGLQKFMKFAFEKRPPGATEILCPCKECANRYYKNYKTVWTHCVVDGFDPKYTNWTLHGEEYVSTYDCHNNDWGNDDNVDINDSLGDCMRQMVQEGLGVCNKDIPDGNQASSIEDVVETDAAAAKFLQLLKDAETELWEGCEEFTTLSFIVEIMQLKAISGWPDKSFTDLLKILKRGMPKSAKLPKSYSEAYKMTTDLGFGFKTWDVCPNHCMIYRNENEGLDKCKVCGSSRYQKQNEGIVTEDKAKKVAEKKVWYFPLKPSLQRMYWSSKTASLMQWHAKERVDDGVLRHPADSRAWKEFDRRYPSFSSDPRNVRLALASDGFNPFRTMSISHSTWPVVLIPYNLPPWHCMKQQNFILSILIQGSKSPGNKIDVYLQLLVEELKELWEVGVTTYDSFTNEMFTLRASLMWTINDFPAYATLSGWVGKGEYACPSCNMKPQGKWLKHGGKWCFIGHRRFLDRNHPYRKDKHSFDGYIEVRGKPKLLSGSEILKQVEKLETEYKIEDVFRKKNREEAEKQQARREKRKVEKSPWKKKSIFWELPYWEHNLVRHNLDVMHIEKNVYDNLLFTLLGAEKSKDGLKARLDLKEMNIRKPLHPQALPSGKFLLPPAQFTMSKADKETFLNVLKRVRVPDGYSSNISRCVHPNEGTIWGLKSHDCHILIQQLLPLAARRTFPPNVVKVIIELANFFRQLCSKVNTIGQLENLQKKISVTLGQLEKIFPPGWFDVMEHLTVHLAEEAILAGPVQPRWMYSIERYLSSLKCNVRNRARPEASMAKAMVAEECMNFCARYLDNVETKSNRKTRNDDGGNDTGRFVGAVEDISLDYITRAQAHRYVLFNTEGVEPYLEKHVIFLRSKMPRSQPHQLQKEHNQKFDSWFKDYVCTTKDVIPENLCKLAMGPFQDGKKCKSYIINGFRFRVDSVDRCRKSQNSGVMLNANVTSYASRKDKNPVVGDVNFYGKLMDIIEIRYSNSLKFVLFKCDWVDNVSGKKQDQFDFTLVNFKHKLYKENRVIDEPFILASQAQQVWYDQDPKDKDWHVVMRMIVRDSFDIYSKHAATSSTDIPQIVPFASQHFDENVVDGETSWVREGVDALEVHVSNHTTVEDLQCVDDDDE